MDLLILVRSDITNLIIMIDLLIFSLAWRKKGAHAKDSFIYLVIATLGHVAFGLITEITVNTPATPHWLNYTCHIFYYAFALMFVAEYYRYVLSLILPRKVLKMHMAYAYTVCGLSLISVPAFGLTFIEGVHTNYSSGPGVLLCFVVTFLMFIIASIIFMLHSRRIEKATIFAIVPITLLSLIFGVLQYNIVEFLYTGSAMTLITITVFFIIENPAQSIQERAFIDYTTGLYNRNCYEEDMNKFAKEFPYKMFAVVLFDLNNLKYANDNFGHKNGDNLIIFSGEALQTSLTGAKKIYRIGGDEFLALYVDSHIPEVEPNLRDLEAKCEELSSKTVIPLKLAHGYEIKKENEGIEDTIKRADQAMYKNKALLKSAQPMP